MPSGSTDRPELPELPELPGDGVVAVVGVVNRRHFVSLIGLVLLSGGCGHPRSQATESGSATPVGAGGGTESAHPQPTFVRGTNTYLTTGILEANSEDYGGSWVGSWSYDDASASGDITADVDIDYRGRRVTAKCAIGGAMLASAIVPFDIDFAVDSFTYHGDTKTFAVHYDSPLGSVRVTDNGGGGRFTLTMGTVTGHPEVTSITATGAANHPSSIPVQFEIKRSDGSARRGTINFKPV